MQGAYFRGEGVGVEHGRLFCVEDSLPDAGFSSTVDTGKDMESRLFAKGGLHEGLLFPQGGRNRRFA
jgi:hypothetical protein